jgi:uncharacterized membrane protein
MRQRGVLAAQVCYGTDVHEYLGNRAMQSTGNADPVVRSIAIEDVVEALIRGLRDFQAAPRYGLLFGSLYAAGGLIILACLGALSMTYLVYPLGAGFAIIGPFVALGFYEVSRRQEQAEPITLVSIWRTVRSRREIAWMAFVTVFVLVVWMYQVRLLLALFLGNAGSFASMGEFIRIVLTTNEGLLFLAVGNVIGAALSLILFSLTVVSFPLLLERDVDFVTAMITSLRAVAASPLPMVGWGVLVAVLLILSALPMFLGLVVTLPVLGHATWHLYRRIVVSPDGASTG